MKKLKKRYKILIFAFIVLVIALYGFIYIVPKVSDVLVGTYVAEYRKLDVGVDKKCIIIRDEEVVNANGGGEATHVRKQGDRVRVGSKVLSIGGEGYFTEAGGILSFYYDGLEKKLNSTVLNTIDETVFEQISSADASGPSDDSTGVKECKEGDVAGGEPVYKLVTGDTWYVVSWLSQEEAVDYAESDEVAIKFPEGGEVLGNIESLTPQGDKIRLVISSDKFYSLFDKYRDVTCRLTVYTEEGLIIQNSSITEIDGQKGVYVVNKQGHHVFTPIKILYTYDDVSLIVSNVYFNADGDSVGTVRNFERIIKDYTKARIESTEGEAEGDE